MPDGLRSFLHSALWFLGLLLIIAVCWMLMIGIGAVIAHFFFPSASFGEIALGTFIALSLLGVSAIQITTSVTPDVPPRYAQYF